VVFNRIKKLGDRRSECWLPILFKKVLKMKKGIHPEYREVVFHDVSNDFKFITRSTINTRDTIDFEGKNYPLVKIEISAESHPYYTLLHR
jgi:large subunit ribosomal protein L31